MGVLRETRSLRALPKSAWRRSPLYVVAGAVTLLSGVSVALGPGAALAAIGTVVLGTVLVVNARHASWLLVVLAVPLARPNFFGESYSVVAAVLVYAAAVLAIVSDHGRLLIATRAHRTLRSVAFWIAVAYLWLLFRAANFGFGTPVQPLIQSILLVVTVIAGAAIVMAEEGRSRAVARGFIAVVLIECASYVVTAIIWAIGGVGSGLVAHVPGTAHSFASDIYFPGTITTATQTVLGLTMPRFDGIGREPGWMAMWCALAYFLIPRITKRRSRVVRAMLLVGMLATFSTAGFGVFLVVWSFEKFLRPRRGGDASLTYLRWVVGGIVMVAAVWLAIKAPVFGLDAKSIMNATSLDDRTLATRAGLNALRTSPLVGTSHGSGVNLVASIAGAGLPFSLAVLAALFMPLRSHPARGMALGPISVLAITLVTSQPAQDSTWVYVAAVIIYAVTLPPEGPANGSEVGLANAARPIQESPSGVIHNVL
jgi:hypothetical protein